MSKSRFYLLLMLALSGCAPSAEMRVAQAINDPWYSDCLKNAHWTVVTREGAINLSPMLGGASFTALDKAADLFPPENYVFAAVFVSDVRTMMNRPKGSFLEAYERAGSPSAAPNKMASDLEMGNQMITLDRKYGSFSIRGTASGWLSKEDNLDCGSDITNGRYFIINEFRPSFAVPSE